MNIDKGGEPPFAFDIRLDIDLDPRRDFSRPTWLPWDAVLLWPEPARSARGKVHRGVECPDPLYVEIDPVKVLGLSLWLKLETAPGHTEYWVTGPGYECLPARQRLDLLDDFETHREGMESEAEYELGDPLLPTQKMPGR